MKTIICAYCEGNDTKFAAFGVDKDKVTLLRASSVDVYGGGDKPLDQPGAITMIEAGQMINLDESANPIGSVDSSAGQIFESLVNSELQGIKLAKAEFIPVLTEPAVFYHTVAKRATGSQTKQTTTRELLHDEVDAQGKRIDRDTFGKLDLADGGHLTVYLRQDNSCIKMINKLAQYNGRRYYKIRAVKSAEVSLAGYVAKKKKFFPDDYSLIVYIGKEYSKLIFLQGRKLRHIGSTLDIGTSNLHTYDVYFSKILLEMENGGIPTLDNIIVCGEDVSENLILSFYGTFPETNVSRLEFDDLVTTGLPDDVIGKLSAFAVPIAVISEVADELLKKEQGINLLPKYVKDEQKFFQFAWHGYLMVPLLFAAAFFITQQILGYQRDITSLNKDIQIQTELKRQNLEILSQIQALEGRISGFDQTQAILDSVSLGTGLWGRLLDTLVNFNSKNRSYWIRTLALDDNVNARVEGHSLNKPVIPRLTGMIDSAYLKSVTFDPIKDEEAYRFIINFKAKVK